MSWRNRAISHRVGYWPLNGDADDVSGYGNDGTLVNSPTWADAPWGRQCVELNGSNAHVNLGDLTYLNSVGSFTIAFWMNQDVIDQTDVFFNKIVDASNRIRVSVFAGDGILTITVANGANTNGSFDYSTVVSAAAWHHIAIVFDGSQADDASRLIVYVDGAPVTLAFTGPIPSTTADLSGVDATIGYSSTSFDGKFSEFQIFSSALTRDEVVSLMRGHD